MRKPLILVAAILSAALLHPVAAMAQKDPPTTTPIKHLVVIFDENNSFDHYFGTYPVAKNPMGEPVFIAAPDTPPINGLTGALLSNNPNALLSGPTAAPFRLDRSQAETCDNDNHYTDEQAAYNGGLLNQFALLLSGTTVAAPDTEAACIPYLSMGYYDGNTVTALWNYAQHFAMGDNFFASTYGTTVMGHLNLISGQTAGATTGAVPPTNSISGKVIKGSVIANVDPISDDCSTGAAKSLITMSGLNVGDLLGDSTYPGKGVTWGWFYGDWTPASVSGGIATCDSEYDSHYAPFQYYASTANSHHTPPTSPKTVGYNDPANHQYAITDLWNAIKAGNMPAVTFIKPPHLQNGHPSDSTPLAEQTFLVDTINQLMQTPYWKDMAIVITWDDSDGWYDHVLPPVVSPSNDSANDALLGVTHADNDSSLPAGSMAGLCGTPATGAYLDRCGYGPRLPFLAISPFAKHNFVDHSLMDQSSILAFIEDNWQTGQIGNQSFDAIAGSILNMFDFGRGPDFDHDCGRGQDFAGRIILNDETGEVAW
jgi:phospholipase C